MIWKSCYLPVILCFCMVLVKETCYLPVFPVILMDLIRNNWQLPVFPVFKWFSHQIKVILASADHWILAGALKCCYLPVFLCFRTLLIQKHCYLPVFPVIFMFLIRNNWHLPVFPVFLWFSPEINVMFICVPMVVENH